MGLPELLVEHRKSDKSRKVVRVRPGGKLFVIGSSNRANLQLSGDGVEGCHVALRFRNDAWYLCDLVGGDTVKVDGHPATEAKLDGSALVEIGQHRLQLLTHERGTELFKEKPEAASSGAGLELHQIVVRARGRVVETKVLPHDKAFKFHDGEKLVELPAPKDGHWVSNSFGARVVQQRLVARQEMLAAEKVAFDRDLRKPLAIALLVFAFLISSVLLLNPRGEKKNEVVLDNKSMDIIYNAKAVKKKKIEAQKVTKTAKAKAGGTSDAVNAPVAPSSAPEESMAPKVSDKPSAALTSLRQSGLSSLVGKIAKRANKQGIMVAAQGVSADNAGAGRAFYSTGTSLNGGGGSAAKEGPTFRLGGIATKGRAGGTGNFKEGTALAGGNVGSGDLVAMVDEETVIEGGLDRDAIAEVIRRNLGQIRYCYGRQVSSNPELYGKVLVKFTIGAAGEVTEPRVDTSTLKSAMVEGCIMRRLASWKFPEPKGGTQVKVSYPFLFKAN